MPNRDHLSPLSEMKNYKVSEEDPDVRGWSVVTSDGQHMGTVRDLLIDPSRMKVEYFSVGDGQGDDVLVPAQSAHVDRVRHQVLLGASSGAGSTASRMDYTGSETRGTDYASGAYAGRTDSRDARLTRSEEELRIGKREVEAGEVVVAKHVETERVREDVPVERERVRVERRPVSSDAYASADITADEIRVPVVEEELVIEKRPVVREEIVISKERLTDTETVDTELRRERVDVTGDTELVRDDMPSSRRRD
jgi:uncharacterized protein (TIGR02271 family)